MAKTLNILKSGGAVPFADGGLKLSKSIRTDEIESHPDFQALFSIDEELLERITKSIRDNSFDNSQPVHIWIQTYDDGTTHKFLIDGYTRLQAAKNAGLTTIPFFEHKFKTFDEAYKYVLALQVNRRNLDSSELLRNVAKLMGTDFIQNADGKKSEAVADLLGISPRTAEKAISVMKEADEETLQQIENNEITVNKAYEKNHPKKSKKEKTEEKLERSAASEENGTSEYSDIEDFDDIADRLDDNEGNPMSVQVRSRDMSEVYKAPQESDIDRRLIERYREGFVNGFKISVSEVCYRIYDTMKELLLQGKTIDEIESEKIFEDFSYSVIAPNLNIPTDAEGILKEFNV